MSLHGRPISGAPFIRSSGTAAHVGFDVPTPTTAPAASAAAAPLTLLSRTDERASGSGSALPADREYLERIAIRSRSRILLLDAKEVAWLEAYGNYVRFHTVPREGGGEPSEPMVHTVRGTLSSYEERLDPARFVRIHRSVIVNVDVVRELHARRTGDFTLVTRSGERLTLSRNFRNRVPQLRRLLAS